MTLNEKKERLVRELSALPTGEDRLTYLISLARARPSLSPDLRTDAHLIPGCLAKLWFVPCFSHGQCHFNCDSDSLVVKAVASLLCDLYDGQKPAEILAHDPSFLAPLGITQHLTPNRRNSLSKIWEYIRFYAAANDGLWPT